MEMHVIDVKRKERVRSRQDWLWFCFSFVEEVARPRFCKPLEEHGKINLQGKDELLSTLSTQLKISLCPLDS